MAKVFSNFYKEGCNCFWTVTSDNDVVHIDEDVDDDPMLIENKERAVSFGSSEGMLK